MAKRRRADSSSPAESDTRPETISTTCPGFMNRALQNGILLDSMAEPPANLADIRARLYHDGGATSSTKSAYEDYAAMIRQAVSEQDVVVRTSYRILKEFDDKDYQPHFNLIFTELSKDVSFNDGLSPPRPDFVEGFSPDEFHPFPVASKLPGKAVLTDEGENSITLPHIAGEWKRPQEGLTLASKQSAYYGATLVYARSQALAYLGDNDPPGQAFVYTFATNGKEINFFAHYAAPSKHDKGKINYHQHLIDSALLTKSYKNFDEGRRQLQNLQDLAKEQSDALRTRLINHWRSNNGTQSSGRGIAPGSGSDGVSKEP